jgi:hypothetical protein
MPASSPPPSGAPSSLINALALQRDQRFVPVQADVLPDALAGAAFSASAAWGRVRRPAFRHHGDNSATTAGPETGCSRDLNS